MFPFRLAGIFVLLLFYIAPVSSTDECPTSCTWKNGTRTVGNETTGPPRLKFEKTSQSIVLMSSLGVKCRLCQSNPASTIEWLFNGKPLHFKREKMHIIHAPCQEKLLLLAVLHEDEGNYTCVARNKYGAANSTTEVKVYENDCSGNCVLTHGKHQIGDKRLHGPPRTKTLGYDQLVLVNTNVMITCALCQSNPPSTLTWFHNGRPIDLKRSKIQVISGLCQQSLNFQALKSNAGNYTCMARNELGVANATSRIVVIDNNEFIWPRIFVKVEGDNGTVLGSAVKIGASVNLTCAYVSRNCLPALWTWTKNGKLIAIESKQEISVGRCTTKLVIDRVMSNTTGRYLCSVSGWTWNANATSENMISIDAVPCFEGFYCPATAHAAKRCPNGTFTILQNATELKQCQPCPAEAREETLLALKKKNGETAKIFEMNCPYSMAAAHANKKSSLSGGEIAAIAVALTLLAVVVLLASLYAGMKYCRNYKRLVQRPHGSVQIEIPDVPPSRDVFVCYSSKNREWVHNTLLSNLRAQHFETFIDFVDFEIGLPIHQNIVNGIYGSRKTIFVLSKDSLRSYYARTELSQALVAGRQTGHQVIVILYERCKVPEEISNIVYLDWTDEKQRGNFWKKLYEAVRKPMENS